MCIRDRHKRINIITFIIIIITIIIVIIVIVISIIIITHRHYLHSSAVITESILSSVHNLYERIFTENSAQAKILEGPTPPTLPSVHPSALINIILRVTGSGKYRFG